MVKEEIIQKYISKKYEVDNLINNKQDYDLSIIIPCYNVANYIQKCLDSVLKQKTQYSFEVICIDDGSKDETLSILNEYHKKNNRVKVYHQENSGISKTRNKGLSLADGKYIAFVDSDDYISEDFIEKMLKIAKNNDADYVKCGYIKFNYKNERMIYVKGKEITNLNKKLGNKILEINGYMWGAVIRKELFRDIVFPPDYWFEDMIIRMLILRKCMSFIFIKECLYYYNVRLGSATKVQGKVQNQNNLDQLYLVEKIYEYSNKINLNDDAILYKLIVHELGNVLCARVRSFDMNNQKYVFKLASEFWNKLSNTRQFKYSILEKVYIFSFENDKFYIWNWMSKIIMAYRKIQNKLFW